MCYLLFRNRLQNETERLLEKAKSWEAIGERLDTPEKAKDEIDSVVGQTRLLANNKFKQFKTLIDNCENKSQNITYDDLDGFWEMMFIQVNYNFLNFTVLSLTYIMNEQRDESLED